LLGIDWYIDQLGNAINKAAPVPILWKPEQYRGELRNYIQYAANPSIPQDKYINLTEVLNYVGQGDMAGRGSASNQFPTKNFFIPVDKELIMKNHVLAPGDTSAIVDQVQFSGLSKNVAYKNDLAILNILAVNAWKRPIYFANSIDPDHYEGLQEYLQLEGLAYKLIPVRTPGSSANSPMRVNIDKCMDLILNKFEFGGAEKGTVHYDQTNRRMLNTPRVLAFQLAENLIRLDRKADALKVIDHVLKMIHEKSYPTVITQEDKTMILLADASIKAGGTTQAKAITDKLMKFAEDDINYMNSLSEKDKGFKVEDCQFELTALNFLASEANTHNMPQIGKGISDKINILARNVPQQQR
jgi:hypothetical protein